ncbi:hypothetical protein E4U14_004006 [Claviceps sp. LM454 group G7]|nr:hypothetical protein E4U14_004006 [Claviceps sp. LM454 group G7]
MNSSLNSRFTEVQFCAKSDTNGGICTASRNKNTRNKNTMSRLESSINCLGCRRSDYVLDPLSSLHMGNEIQGIHSVVEMPVIATHGDRCMLARAGAGQSDMTA